MQRTQLYITDAQERRLAQMAADAGVSKAEVVRRLLDQGLGVDDGSEERRRAILATAGILRDADDWGPWLAGVRGSGAHDRLKALGCEHPL